MDKTPRSITIPWNKKQNIKLGKIREIIAGINSPTLH